jgi:hypothetical protein
METYFCAPAELTRQYNGRCHNSYVLKNVKSINRVACGWKLKAKRWEGLFLFFSRCCCVWTCFRFSIRECQLLLFSVPVLCDCKAELPSLEPCYEFVYKFGLLVDTFSSLAPRKDGAGTYIYYQRSADESCMCLIDVILTGLCRLLCDRWW